MEAKTFKMYRTADISTTHDVNQVNPPDEVQFEGIVFSDGKVAVRWLTAKRSVSVWDSMEDLLAIHGHPEYGSKLVWAAGITWDIAFKAGQEAGRKEVASYVQDEIIGFEPTTERIAKWQAKLKEWGL